LKNIQGFSEMLLRRYKGKLDPKAEEFIGYINSGVKTMQTLITDVLEYSRTSMGEAEVCRSGYEPMRTKGSHEPEGNDFREECAESLTVKTCLW
jgi:signal transduction histidine kinase